jgi:hypothetical protein
VEAEVRVAVEVRVVVIRPVAELEAVVAVAAGKVAARQLAAVEKAEALPPTRPRLTIRIT